MKYHQAIKLLIGSTEKEIKSLAIDANLHERFHADNPGCVNASKRRKKLREAIRTVTMEEK